MTSTSWRTLVLAPYFTPAVRAGGPVRTISALVAQAPSWIDVDVITRHSDHGGPLPPTVPEGTWVAHGRHRVLYLGSAPWAAARAAVSHDSDLLYLNSFFDPAFALLPQLALALVRRSRPVMVAPRGELSPGAMALKPGKKRLLLLAYRALGLHRRVLWHASAEREAEEIRQVLGPRVRVLVRENDTGLPLEPQAPTGRSAGALRAVFLSRLVPKKGLHVLLEALSRVQGDLRLDVYGTEEDGPYVRHCRALATACGKAVFFHGPVDPDDVRERLAPADVMFFPTASENFGHVIAEALSVSCPVVIPDTTPWTDLVHHGGGAVVRGLDPGAWANEVEAWAQLTPEDLDERRVRAARAYSQWRTTDQPVHVLAQAHDRLSPD